MYYYSYCFSGTRSSPRQGSWAAPQTALGPGCHPRGIPATQPLWPRPGAQGFPPLQRPLFPFRHVVRQFARGDPLGGAPVCICDIVLEILAADSLEPPAPNLKSAKLSSMNEVPDEAAFGVQFFGDLLDGQKAALVVFSGHPDILM